MPSPGVALYWAMSELLGTSYVATETPAPAPGYRGLVELYGSNANIAAAAGYPTAGEVTRPWRARRREARTRRQMYSLARELEIPGRSRMGRAELEAAVEGRIAQMGRTAHRRRASFMRELQRYATGQRRPGGSLDPTLGRLRRAGIRRQERRRRVVAETLGDVARAMRDRGATATIYVVVMAYDGRERSGLPPCTFGGRARTPVPESFVAAVEATDWDAAAEIFWAEMWGPAYGVPGWEAEEVDGLGLTLGNQPGAYDQGMPFRGAA